MLNNSKKKIELDTLSKVYDLNGYSVECSEKPDFKLCCTADSQNIFGVEITENFLHDGYARLNKIPDYINNVINRHSLNKKDQLLFNVREIELISPDKEHFYENAIIDYSSPQDYLTRIEKRIKEKNNRVSNYNSMCKYHNLIINDESNYLFKTGNKFVFSSSLIDVILKSPFREIFFITKVEKEEIYLPLKLGILGYWFGAINRLVSAETKFNKFFSNDSIILFLRDLFHSFDVCGVKSIVDSTNNLVLEYSKYSIKVEDSKLKIKILPELGVVEGNQIENEGNTSDIVSEFKERITSIHNILSPIKTSFSVKKEKIKT